MKKNIIAMIIILAAACGVLSCSKYSEYRFHTKDDPTKWENEIRKIEVRTAAMREKSAIVFIGSSTIRKWGSLDKDMAPIPALNHGFGGSRIQDSTYFVPRLVISYNPSMVVFYAGDNDIYLRDIFGKKADTAARCLEDFKAFVAAVHRDLPELRIYFISIKPSLSRMKYWPQMKKANGLIKEYCAKDKRLAYIDITGSMLSNEGNPLEKYFVKDGLHLSKDGYALWVAVIKPILEKDYRTR